MFGGGGGRRRLLGLLRELLRRPVRRRAPQQGRLRSDARPRRASAAPTCAPRSRSPSPRRCAAGAARSSFPPRSPARSARASAKCASHICPRCAGVGAIRERKTVEVAIPQTVRDGTVLRLRDLGEPGEEAAGPGDLYLTIRLKSDSDLPDHGQRPRGRPARRARGRRRSARRSTSRMPDGPLTVNDPGRDARRHEAALPRPRHRRRGRQPRRLLRHRAAQAAGPALGPPEGAPARAREGGAESDRGRDPGRLTDDGGPEEGS